MHPFYPSPPGVTLLDELGRGEGGIVFRAERDGAPCLVKLPSSAPPPRPGSEHAFAQDALALARLRDVPLPRILKVGDSQEPAYVVMEAVSAQPLERLLLFGIDAALLELVALQLAQALRELHQAGFFGAKLTSEQVCLDPATQTCYLLDLGTLSRGGNSSHDVEQARQDGMLADIRALCGLLQSCIRHGRGNTARLRNTVHHLGSGSLSLSDFVERLQDPGDVPGGKLSPAALRARREINTMAGQDCGRDVLHDLRAAYRKACNKAGAVVELVGPLGSGKSHALRHFADELRTQGATVLFGTCRDRDWQPYSMLARMLVDHVSRTKMLAEAARQAHLQQLATVAGDMLPWLVMLVPELAPLSFAPPILRRDSDAQQLFEEGIAKFLLNYIQSKSITALVVEDVQWIEPSSRSVLYKLISQLAGTPALVVISRREGEEGAHAAQRLLQDEQPGRVTRLVLDAISAREAHRIVNDYLGTDDAVDEVGVQALCAQSDGTPQSLLELLERALEHGILMPAWGRWQLDVHALRRLTDVDEPAALVAQQLAALPKPSRDALQTLAAVPDHLATGMLALAHGVSQAQVALQLAPCIATRWVVASPPGHYALAREHLRHHVQDQTSAHEWKHTHGRLAFAFEVLGRNQGADACELARHYALAGDLAEPDALGRAAMAAAEHSLAIHDEPRRLFFLELAESASHREGLGLSASLLHELADSCWRVGQAERSLSYFKQALDQAQDALTRANLLGRCAWIHHYRGDKANSLACLQQAFSSLNQPAPRHMSLALSGALASWALRRIFAPRQQSSAPLTVEEHSALEIQCMLLARAYRIHSENAEVATALYCLVQASRLVSRIPTSDVAVFVYCVVGAVLGLAGLGTKAERELAQAEANAQELRDPTLLTICLVTRHVAAAWTGHWSEARKFAQMSLLERGHLLDLCEFCFACLGMHVLETVMGEPLQAWAWLERIADRVALQGQAPPIVDLVCEAAQATLTTLDRSEDYAAFARRVRLREAPPLPGTEGPRLFSQQFRLQRMAEAEHCEEEFEALVAEFDGQVRGSHLAHPAVAACYVHILHARIHQALTCNQERAHTFAAALTLPLTRLRKAAAKDAIKAHLQVGLATQAFLRGKMQRADALLSQAERNAQSGPGIWVLFAVARLRAHILRKQGWLASAQQQALIAARLAQKHGHRNRLRWIVEDFGADVISDEVLTASKRSDVGGDDGSMRRNLDALLSISRTGSAELSPQRHTAVVLEEIVQALDAERGFLFLRQDGSLQQAAAFQYEDGEPEPPAGLPWAIDAVQVAGQVLHLEPGVHESASMPAVQRPTLIAPMVLHDEVTGVVYVDRHVTAGNFGDQHADLLLGLANQVPVALELAASLRERDQLAEHLQKAQKMEAIGQLAGGIAHDFNNLLATIQIAGGTLAELVPADSIGKEEVDDILDVASRGAAMTRQLLTFARRETAEPHAINLNSVVSAMLPMLSRLVSRPLTLFADLENDVPAIMADTTQVEQVLLNLVTNARDASHDAGGIYVTTRKVHLTAPVTSDAPLDLEPGHYLVLGVRDEGQGMSPAVQAKIFEPFFSTKPSLKGTGLGLSTVHGIVKQFGGVIDVKSTVGAGTDFRIYWPAASNAAITESGRVVETSSGGGPEMLLLVDDDAIFCRAAQRALQGAGYEVLTAGSRKEALACMDEMGAAIDLLITAARLPDGNADGLVKQLRAWQPSLKALFISGEPLASYANAPSQGTEFLLKPFSLQTLAVRVRRLLDSRPAPLSDLRP